MVGIILILNIAHDHFDKVRQHSPFLQTIYNMMCSAVPTTRKTNTVSKRQTMIPEHHVNKDPGSLQRCILPQPATATLRKLASHGGEFPRDSGTLCSKQCNVKIFSRYVMVSFPVKPNTSSLHLFGLSLSIPTIISLSNSN